MPEDHEAPNDEGKPVEVDQGALIHKILARYPGEFTLFRELLQNSDDAQSNAVEIRFETVNATSANPVRTLPDHKPSDIVQWTFKNDGNKFTSDDWARLSKIAMGNPNPAKVGAFGVGFYSLFSVTDHPAVLSGGDGRQFYWKGGMLYSRKVNPSSKEKSSPWTTFKIPLRTPGTMPEKFDFMRFLTTSITFMAHLKNVEVFLDGDCIGHINKAPGLMERSNFPIPLLPSSSLGLMTIQQLHHHRFTITAKISSKSHEPTTGVPESTRRCESQTSPQSTCAATSFTSNFFTTKVDLTVFTADVHTKVDKELLEELLRSTSKIPPSQLNYRLVYTGKDEYDQGFTDQAQNSQPFISIFQGLRADLDGASHPRIFIGHSTSQTTGIGGHMAAPFIPTVERESMDLVNVAVWNSELLYVGGFLARAIYESELTAIDTLWKKEATSGSPGILNQLRDRFIHVLKFFTFYDSTPSPKVAQLMQRSFYSCSTSPLRLLSSVGVHYTSDIRLFDPLCSKFLKDVPMLPPEVAEIAERIINALPIEHKIHSMTFPDMKRDLHGRTLNQDELLAYLGWQISTGLAAGMARLSDVVGFRRADGMVIQLSTIKSFIDPDGLGAHIPSGAPIPRSLIPREISDSFNLAQLLRLGWREFTIADWLGYISQPKVRSDNPKYDFVHSAGWAECVLHIVSVAWTSSDKIPGWAQSVLANEKCIPVGHELYCAKETYLPNRDIPAFSDLGLRIVRFPSCRQISWEMECVLVALGVQQHLALELLLKEMVETGKWNTCNLIDYLVQVADTLSPTEITQLASYPAFAGVDGNGDNSKRLFRADELYPPIHTFRRLNLRLIDLSGRFEWRDASPEAELMYRLGLRRHPVIDDIIDLSSRNTDVGEHAFDYLCTNLRILYSSYKRDRFADIAFIPAENKNGPRLEKPGDVFLDSKWKALGLSVIRHRDRETILEELGVERHPPSSLLVKLLTTRRPPNEEIAREWFEILSDHVSCFGQDELDVLSKAQIVPKTIPGQDRVWLTPIQCYLGKSTKHDLYSELFHFVNFGNGGIQFLRACRAKNEPSEEDVAECLVENHDKFYKLAGHKRFLQELRDLATRHTRISNNTISKMKIKPILLGIQREKATNSKEWNKIYSLQQPKDVLIVNDVHTYQFFGDSIVAAPENMLPELEDFYVLLGCRYLTTVVREEYNPSEEFSDAMARSKYRGLIEQRVPLFLHYYQPQGKASAPRFSCAVNVRVCKHLSVSQTLITENKGIVETRSVWATAQDEQGKMQVWIAPTKREDMYELAVSICRVLFGAVKLNDALLLSSILSEDLDVLRGRGYEIGRIQSPQHHEDSDLAGETDQCRSVISKEAQSPPTIDPATQKAVTTADVDSTPARTEDITSHPSVEDSAESGSSPGTMSHALSKAAHVVRSMIPSIISSNAATSTPRAGHQVTPPSHIRAAVEEAIQACKSTPGHHRDYRADVIKPLDDGYCNISEPIESLRFLGSLGGVDIYVGQGVSDYDSFMRDKQDQINHFARIITNIAKIYDLPINSLRIFYDTAAGCIAFNRRNAIYLNLRYFEVWHYQDVKSGRERRASSSWFLTLAHEIAHNLVAGHDSEHEFWLSAICEAHMDAFFAAFGGNVGFS